MLRRRLTIRARRFLRAEGLFVAWVFVLAISCMGASFFYCLALEPPASRFAVDEPH